MPSLFHEKQKALEAAARSKSVGAVREALAGGAQPDGDELFRPLCQAAADNSFAIAQALLDAGANPNLTESGEKKTPLMIAAARGHAATIEALLGDSDVEATHVETGWTALFFAARSRASIPVASLQMLAERSDLSRRDAKGRTALILAAEAGNALAVEFLGEKINNAAVDREGATALARAAVAASQKTRSSLSDRAFAWLAARATAEIVNAQDSSGQTTLMRLLALGALDHAERIQDASDWSRADKQGRTALAIALDKLDECQAKNPGGLDARGLGLYIDSICHRVGEDELRLLAAERLSLEWTPVLRARVEAADLRAQMRGAKTDATGAGSGRAIAAGEGEAPSAATPARRL